MEYCLFEKRLTKTDRDQKFAVPSGWLGTLLPPTSTAEAAGLKQCRAKVAVHVVDEWGKSYTFRLRLRPLPSLELESGSGQSYYSKPEFMAKGWRKFVKDKGLQTGESVYFWCERDLIRVKARAPPRAFMLFSSTFLS